MTNDAIMNVVKVAINAQLKSPASAQLISIFLKFIIKKDNDNKELETIKVAEVTHSAFYTPFYVAIENGFPVVKSSSVAAIANAKRAKSFATNYIVISIITGIMAIIGYFVLKAIIGF